MQPLEYYLNTEEVPPAGVGPCQRRQHRRRLCHYPPDTHSPEPAAASQIVEELGPRGLRHFHGPIGLRSARWYGIDPRDARN